VTGRERPVIRAPSSQEQADKRQALKLWEGDRSRLLLAQPFLALLAMQLDLVPVVDSRIATACTDGERVYVSARFLLDLEPEERVFVLAHEIWHCALGHFARRGNREARYWNLAVDHEVNALLEEQDFVVPEDAVLFESWRGRSAEMVDEWLQRRPERRLPERGRLADHHGALDEHACAGDAVADPEFRPGAGGRDRIWQDWKTRVIAAAQQIEQRGGTLPGTVRRTLDAYRRPSVPWQRILRQFVHRSRRGRRTWTRPHRRFFGQGIILPGDDGGTLDIAVAIDTSGSTSGCLRDFVSEIRGIVSGYSVYRLRVLTNDAAVHSVQEFSPTRPLRPEALELAGGGGTDFRPVFDYLAREEPPEALVFFTDGFGEAPEHRPRWPVLWALPAHGAAPARWGRVVRLA
jgi:predicted metal-dependent peptidase